MTTHTDIVERIRLEGKAIASRLDGIARQMAELQRQKTELEAQAAKLATAQEVVEGLLPTTDAKALGHVVSAVVSSLAPEAKASRKPASVPPVLEMTNEALAAFEARGRPWLSAPEVTEYIRERWWPEVKSDFISPQMWRAAKRGDLLKRGNLYARKGTENAEDPTTGVVRPSLSNGAVGSSPT